MNLTKEEINDILDNYEGLFANPEVIGMDIKFDSAQPYLEIDKIDGPTEKALEVRDEIAFVDLPSKINVFNRIVETSELEEFQIEVRISKCSRNIDDMLFEEDYKLKTFQRPVLGGTLISAEGIRGKGTLGASFLYKNGQYCFVSNNHVLSKNRPAGNIVFQPIQQIFSNQLGRVADRISTKYYTRIPNKPIFNTSDVAWGFSSPNISSMEIKDIGQVRGRRSPNLGETILLFGGATQQRKEAEIISVTKRYRSRDPVMGHSFWRDGIELNKKITNPGDSGSAYVAKSDFKIVGLHRAANINGTSKGCLL